MSPRLDVLAHGQAQYAALAAFDGSITLDPRLGHLVKLRASQINGCAFCIDMHWRDARAAGESDERLYLLSAWREVSQYSARRGCPGPVRGDDADRRGHVPDGVWQLAEEQFDPEELTQLVMAVTAINAWNRIAITLRTQPGRKPQLRPDHPGAHSRGQVLRHEVHSDQGEGDEVPRKSLTTSTASARIRRRRAPSNAGPPRLLPARPSRPPAG